MAGKIGDESLEDTITFNSQRQKEIHEKSFDLYKNSDGRIRVGPKTLEDATLNLGSFKRYYPRFGDKGYILQQLHDLNMPVIREISEFFYRTNGVYKVAVDYYANLYRYDWRIIPEIFDDVDNDNLAEKVSKDFVKLLSYCDNSYIKKTCNDIAHKVMRQGAYYGYVVDNDSACIIQELPIDYCRTRYYKGSSPTVEFNMRFFDDKFNDIQYRMKILKMFPDEFQKGYVLYKQGKLPCEPFYDTKSGWYLLDPEYTVKFTLSDLDMPIFVTAIPAILDLDAAQELDRQKQMQRLLKLIVQKLPTDKNGDLIFDPDETRDLHNTLKMMLQNAIGVDVATTIADVEHIDLSDSNASTATDELERVERSVFNALGLSRNLFNAEGNLSLSNSILDDEATVRSLILQFNIFFDRIIKRRNKNQKKYNFRFQMLETTQYNYKDLAKLYKEQAQLGFSKVLPAIALGSSQSEIINAAYFENQILNLTELMVPLMSSNTMSSKDVKENSGSKKTTSDEAETKKVAAQTEENKGGRPELDETEKSDKTLANEAALG